MTALITHIPVSYTHLIGEISYADKVTMDIMTTPEQKENVADLISNITSGTAHVLEEKKILEKV